MISRSDITPGLAVRLVPTRFPPGSHPVPTRFPRWAHLPVRPVEISGRDNRTCRLGDGMSVRLPSNASYAEQVAKEQHWLPRLAPHLPLPIPTPLAAGTGLPAAPGRSTGGATAPGRGPTASPNRPGSPSNSRGSCRPCSASTSPAGRSRPHNFFRGGPLTVYDDETRAAVTALGDAIDGPAALAVWDAAATWTGPPVWVHGDVAEGNALLAGGRLSTGGRCGGA